MRISDWSSDVCSSDLGDLDEFGDAAEPADVGLDDVAAFHVHQHAKAPARRLMLAGGDEEPLGRLFLQRGIAPIIVGGERFLDPFEPAIVPGAVGGADRIVAVRSEERRVGKEGGSTCSTRWLQTTLTKKTN